MKLRRNRILALVPAVCEILRRVRRNGEFVFHTQAGRRWRNNVQRGVGTIGMLAGIPHCTLHDLRRTFISHLAMAGVTEAVVKELAGHASISTTLRYCTRIMPQGLRSAQAKLPFDGVLLDISDGAYRAQAAYQIRIMAALPTYWARATLVTIGPKIVWAKQGVGPPCRHCGCRPLRVACPGRAMGGHPVRRREYWHCASRFATDLLHCVLSGRNVVAWLPRE